MAKRILALVAEPISADVLRSAVGSEDAESAEVLVVAPALNTRKRFFLADPDPAIERAAAVQEETVERLEEEGIDAAGDTGESEPALAIQDALATFAADRIVVFTHAGEKDYREESGLEDAEERFGIPVTHAEISR